MSSTRRHARGFVSAPLILLCAACSTGGNGAPDGAPDSAGDVVDAALEAAVDSAIDAPIDAPSDTPSGDDARDVPESIDVADESAPDATPDSMPDVSLDVAPDASTPTPVLLVGATINSAMPAFGSSYDRGAWAAPVALTGSDCYPPGGGGVTVMNDGRGLAVVRGNGGSLPYSAVWSAGRWSSVTATGGTISSFVSAPHATANGAAYVRQSGSGASNLRVDSFVSARSSWELGSARELLGDNRGVPALAVTSGGQQLVIDGDSRGGYRWMLGAGDTWSALATVTGATVPMFDSASPAVVATQRVGVDEVVAVFIVAGEPQSTARIAWSTFRAGAWTTVVSLATDVVQSSGVTTPMVLTALRDGRVALGYLTATRGVSVGFYNGTSWSPFRVVSGVSSIPQASPFALTRGADANAVLELVYVDAVTRQLRHTRLTDEPAFRWSPPATIDSTRQWMSVWIASRL